MQLEDAQEEFESGNIRKSIALYRAYLRTETDPYKRAKVYLVLSKIYRIQVNMVSAQLELKRAFAELQLVWPQDTFWSLCKYVVGFQIDDYLKFTTDEPKMQVLEFIAELYVEFGLSAYYLRQKWRMYLASVLSRKICNTNEHSPAKMNWYGGTACLLALLRLPSFATKYMKKCIEIAHSINNPTHMGKAQIWHALMMDYLGYPLDSARIFEEMLKKYGHDLAPGDLRLASITLSMNYLFRGQSHESLEALRAPEKYNACFRGEDLGGRDSLVWYSIPSRVMIGEKVNPKNQMNVFRYVLSSNNKEKWLLTQFLACLMAADNWTSIFDHQDLEGFMKRFELLGMKPQTTFFEACFYWIVRAYSKSRYLNTPEQIRDFKKAIMDVKKSPKHPMVYSHYLILETIWASRFESEEVFWQVFKKAEASAKKNKNALGLYHLYDSQMYFFNHKKVDQARFEEAKRTRDELMKQQAWVA